MTTDLLLLPFEGFENHQYSNTVLRLCGFDLSDDLCELHKRLAELTNKAKENKQFVPDNFCSHLSFDLEKDYHYGIITGIVYIFVRDLLELEELHREYYKEDDSDPDPYIDKEKALGTMAYLKTLPKNRKIALFWS